MADLVQAAMDRMVAPLSDLKSRQVFSAEEIASIVRRRRASEYAIRRSHGQVRLADFLSYLQAETQLEELRSLRTKRLLRERRKQNGAYVASPVGDAHLKQHIRQIWMRALRSFPQVDLWMEYLQFLESIKAYGRLGAAYGQCLSLFPKATKVWVSAASHAYFQEHSIYNARILLQRGLRVNKKSSELWLQSLILELHFVAKLQGRKAVLSKVKTGSESDPETGANDDNSQRQQKKKIDNSEELSVGAATDQDALKIARLVVQNACRAIPTVEFRLECVQACDDFPDTQSLKTFIMNQSSDDSNYDNDPQSWIARAAWAITEGDDEVNDDDEAASSPRPAKRLKGDTGDDKGPPFLGILTKAIEAVPTEEMVLEASKFVLQYMSSLSDEDHEADIIANFLNDLLASAAKKFPASSKIVVERSRVLLLLDDGAQAAAAEILSAYCHDHASQADHHVWRAWANAVAQTSPSSVKQSQPTALEILEQGKSHIPIHEPGHLILLIESFGCILQAENSSGADDDQEQQKRGQQLFALLQTMVLLGVGENSNVNPEQPFEPCFGIGSIPFASLAYLALASQRRRSSMRRAYQMVLFESTVIDSARDEEEVSVWKSVIDCAMEFERTDGKNKNSQQRRLLRLCDLSLQKFSGTSFETEFRKRKESILYDNIDSYSGKNWTTSDALTNVPVFDCQSNSFSPTDFLEAFEKFKVVHLRNAPTRRSGTNAISWKDVGSIFDGLDQADKDSWCVETKDLHARSAQTFLKPKNFRARAYCSFLVQNDTKAYQSLLSRLPVDRLPLTGRWRYEPAIWMFFGRNLKEPNQPLDGRPEHTDSVSHDGTWHFQLSGRKVWNIRPTRRLLDHLHNYSTTTTTERITWTDRTQLQVDVREGDVCLIDTRLWFHSTVIPAQDSPSVSYARDFHTSPTMMKDNLTSPSKSSSKGDMTNVDGMYAMEDIESGTIIFTEHDMPDGELHRSEQTNANCEIVELEDGTSAVVSTRRVASGDFFSVPFSDDDDDASSGDQEISDEDG